MTIASRAVLALVVAACACGLIAAQDDPKEVVLLSPDSNAHAILFDAFWMSGYSGDDSVTLATRALKRMEGAEVGPIEVVAARDTGRAALHPDSNPHAILFDAFLSSGWPAGKAIEHANTVTMRILGIEPDEFELNPLGIECWVYPVVIEPCDGRNQPRLTYIDGLYHEKIRASLSDRCPDVASAGFTATVNGTCVTISLRSTKGLFVPCQLAELVGLIKRDELQIEGCIEADR